MTVLIVVCVYVSVYYCSFNLSSDCVILIKCLREYSINSHSTYNSSHLLYNKCAFSVSNVYASIASVCIYVLLHMNIYCIYLPTL